MSSVALSPSNVLATPAQVNPQVKIDLQASLSQAAQNAQVTVAARQTDTVTISLQALKMSDSKNAVTKKAADRDEARKANSQPDRPATPEPNETQLYARKAYSEAP